MMKSKWVILSCLCLGLIGLSQMTWASVSDPNILIEAWTVGGTAPEPLEVVNGGMQDGALLFVDRTTIWGDVGRFVGLDYVKVAMDDRVDPDVQINVSVRKAGTLFLVVDNRIGDGVNTDPPTLTSVMTWVTSMGFTQTSYAIGFSEPATVYSLAVDADPNTITFGPQNDGTSRAAYSIIAAPDGWNFPPVIADVPSSTQVAPGADLVVDATITDEDGPSAVTVLWTTVSKPDGTTVTYSPNDTTADVTVSFSDLGAYTLKLAAYDGEKTTEQIVEVSVQIPTFAVQATDHCMACNDSQIGPTSGRVATITDARNFESGTDTRRRIGYYRYNISDFSDEKAAGKVFANCYLTLNVDKGTSGKNLYVYALKEEVDDITLSTSQNWSTLPGVDNDPVPPLGSEITVDTLDIADISPLVMSFVRPALDVWVSTNTAAALDEVLNADTDGYVILMYVSHDPQNADWEICSPSHSRSYTDAGGTLKGIILQGQIWYPNYATAPNPEINSSVNPSTLTQLSWTNPDPSEEGATVTSNVYFGTTEPNVTDPDYGLDTLVTGTSNEFVTLPYALTRNTTYYWVVDSVDSVSGLVRGIRWTFNTNNNAPVVSAGPNQYLWLDPTSATADLSGTVSDDGYPQPYTTKWEQTSGPVTVATEPNDLLDITVTLPAVGTYVFQLSANDGDLVSADSMEVFVGATPCDAAKAKPGYEQIYSDYNNDCYVDMSDLSEFVQEWLLCNESMDAPCS